MQAGNDGPTIGLLIPNKFEVVRLAIQELGDVSGQELAAHVESKYSAKIDRKFIPVFKASSRDMLRRAVGWSWLGNRAESAGAGDG